MGLNSRKWNAGKKGETTGVIGEIYFFLSMTTNRLTGDEILLLFRCRVQDKENGSLDLLARRLILYLHMDL